VAMIGGFQSDMSITLTTDRNFGNVSVGVLFSEVAMKCNAVYFYLSAEILESVTRSLFLIN